VKRNVFGQYATWLLLVITCMPNARDGNHIIRTFDITQWPVGRVQGLWTGGKLGHRTMVKSFSGYEKIHAIAAIQKSRIEVNVRIDSSDVRLLPTELNVKAYLHPC